MADIACALADFLAGVYRPVGVSQFVVITAINALLYRKYRNR